MPRKFETVDAPPRRSVGQPYETIPLPERRWYQWIHDAFTRLDELAEAQLKALNVLIDQSNMMIAQNDAIIIALGGVPLDLLPPFFFRDYISEDQLDNKDEVSETTPVTIEVLETLGRRARFGFIYSETGTLILKFNDGSPVPLKAADFLNLADLHIEIEKLRIETESVGAITFRLLLV